jgi:uncharacterized protein (DUF885 family)
MVVDTGLHEKRWTRQQAIGYGMSLAEVDRYIAMPGQACSYMIGQLKILELRDKARQDLGDRFDIKEFHRVNTVRVAPEDSARRSRDIEIGIVKPCRNWRYC